MQFIRRYIHILTAAALTPCYAGCGAYIVIGNGTGVRSPDGRFSLAVEIHGAPGHSYYDKTRKKIWVTVTTDNWTHTLFNQVYSLTGSEIEWHVYWSSPEEASVEFYDWGDGVANTDNMYRLPASNHIALLSFVLDKNTGRFVEKHNASR